MTFSLLRRLVTVYHVIECTLFDDIRGSGIFQIHHMEDDGKDGTLRDEQKCVCFAVKEDVLRAGFCIVNGTCCKTPAQINWGFTEGCRSYGYRQALFNILS